MNELLEYQDESGNFVRVKYGLFNRSGFKNLRLANVFKTVQQYGIKVYYCDEVSRRMRLFDILWLNDDGPSTLHESLEISLKQLVKQGLNPDDLVLQLEGIIGELVYPDREYP